MTSTDSRYEVAKEQLQAIGVATENAVRRLQEIPISLHCWQGDDGGGFENAGQKLDGGLAVTSNFPGKARTATKLRADVDKVFPLIPGTHRLTLRRVAHF